MLQTLCQVAFDQYIATGDAPTIRAVSGDPAQDNRWVITTRATTKRILFTNEVKTKTENEEVKLDGTALKKVYASGGDKFLARVHRGNEMDVVNNTIAFMSLNESPSSNPADAMETCRPIVFPYKFVSSDRVSHHMSYRLANPLLKDRLQNDEELRDGFIQLVFQAFRESPVEIAEMPEESRDDYAELMGKCMTEPADILNRLFDQSADLWASTEEIMEIFAPSKKSKDFIGKFLTKSGFTKSQKSINGSRVWGFKGIMPKVQDTDEDATDEGCKC